jgi:transcriptional regulator of arginine metabolism
MPLNKAYRQAQILKIIESRNIHTQDELAAALAKLQIQATQVTLSRDIRDLALVKTHDGYRRLSPQSAPAGPDLATITAEFLLDARQAQNLLVLKTSPGNASSLATALDRADWPGVVGTIAGDDTVLVIAPDAKLAAALRNKILALA